MCLFIKFRLKSLMLKCNKLDDYDLLIICNYVNKFIYLEILDLNSNNITDESCVVFGKILSTTISNSFKVILKHNLFTKDGITKIKQIVNNNKKISYEF